MASEFAFAWFHGLTLVEVCNEALRVFPIACKMLEDNSGACAISLFVPWACPAALAWIE